MCLPMIRERSVPLQAGNAYIPCGKWKQLLVMVFKMHIDLGMTQLIETGCFYDAAEDPRIKEQMKELNSEFKLSTKSKIKNQLKACEVKTQSLLFPPCMAHLYTNLTLKHRLAHEARRHFTLFLKDAGMPLEESINFWSEEYSKPHTCGGCRKSWQEDSKRYIYSIRHMYGLEGGRYNYSVPSCRKIQGMSLSSMAEGGCPFKHFDDMKLEDCLSVGMQNSDFNWKRILHLKAQGKPQEACSLYMTICKKAMQELKTIEMANGEESNINIICNPFEFYEQMKSMSHVK